MNPTELPAIVFLLASLLAISGLEYYLFPLETQSEFVLNMLILLNFISLLLKLCGVASLAVAPRRDFPGISSRTMALYLVSSSIPVVNAVLFTPLSRYTKIHACFVLVEGMVMLLTAAVVWRTSSFASWTVHVIVAAAVAFTIVLGVSKFVTWTMGTWFLFGMCTTLCSNIFEAVALAPQISLASRQKKVSGRVAVFVALTSLGFWLKEGLMAGLSQRFEEMQVIGSCFVACVLVQIFVVFRFVLLWVRLQREAKDINLEEFAEQLRAVAP